MGLLPMGETPARTSWEKTNAPGAGPGRGVQGREALPLCHLRGSSALAGPSVATTVQSRRPAVSGYWWEAYGVPAAATKSERARAISWPSGSAATGTEDLTGQCVLIPTGRCYGLRSETGIRAPYDATLGHCCGWSCQALPGLGEVP